MKKYVFILVAAVTVITASAFAISNKSEAEPEATYWFLMDAAGTSVTTNQVSNPNDLCPDQLEEPDCARQYTESQTEITGGVRHVKSSEVNNYIDYRSKE